MLKPTSNTTFLRDAAKNASNDNVVYTHDLDPVFTVAITTYFILIIISAFVFNLVLIFTVVYKRKLHTVTNILIVNLAIGDMFTAIFVVPFDVDYLIRGYFPDNIAACGFREVSFMLSLPTSVVSLLLLTFERFISVSFPFKRIRYLTKKNTYILITFSWCYTFLVAIFPIIYDKNAIFVDFGLCGMGFPMEYIFFQMFGNFLAPIIVICSMNIFLFRIASKHAIDIRKKSLIDASHSRKARPSMLTFGANLKAAKTVLLLVGIFLLCWLPFIIMAVHNILCDACHPREVTWTGSALNYASIFINPLLYGLRSREIRRELRKIAMRFVYNYCNCAQSPLPSDRTHGNSTFAESVSGDQEYRYYRRTRSHNKEEDVIHNTAA